LHCGRQQSIKKKEARTGALLRGGIHQESQELSPHWKRFQVRAKEKENQVGGKTTMGVRQIKGLLGKLIWAKGGASNAFREKRGKKNGLETALHTKEECKLKKRFQRTRGEQCSHNKKPSAAEPNRWGRVHYWEASFDVRGEVKASWKANTPDLPRGVVNTRHSTRQTTVKRGAVPKEPRGGVKPGGKVWTVRSGVHEFWVKKLQRM